MFTTKNESWNPCPTRNATPSAVTTATKATTRGIPAATAAPKTATRISSAIGTPMPSPRRRSRSEVSVNVRPMLPCPATSVSNPAGASKCSTTETSGPAVASASPISPASVTGISVVRRSADTKPSNPVS